MLRKIIIGVIVVIVGVPVVLIAGSFLLPRHVHVERDAVIAAAPAQVYPYVSDFHKFNEWSPWARRDPNMDYTFEGPDSGVGARMSWQSANEEVGAGTQEIVAATENEAVQTHLDFGAMGTAEAFYKLAPEGAGTRVTWAFDTDLGMNPVSRWMGLMFEKWIGADYEEGLANLKTVAERAAQQ